MCQHKGNQCAFLQALQWSHMLLAILRSSSPCTCPNTSITLYPNSSLASNSGHASLVDIVGAFLLAMPAQYCIILSESSCSAAEKVWLAADWLALLLPNTYGISAV